MKWQENDVLVDIDEIREKCKDKTIAELDAEFEEMKKRILSEREK